MNNSPKVLVCWAGRPGYIPPPVLCENQLTIYSHHDRANPGTINPLRQLADRQDYDLEHVVRQLDDPASFDLVCVSSGANENNQPRNLDAFDCPKVLLVGDTHHVTVNPIRFVMDYLEQERYDMVVSMHNRDHMKWFRQVGNVKPGWFPGLTAQDIPHAFVTDRMPHLGFVGSWRVSHPRRKHFITRLRADNIPFDLQKLSRIASAGHHAKSLIAFNCSLNGDLNMRVHEILSAGGFLLTDKLSAQSGLDDMLVDGDEYVSYSNYRELRDKAKYFIDHPQEALQISRQGLARFQESYRPDIVARQFLTWAISGESARHNYNDAVTLVEGVSMSDRLKVYELAQNQQLRQEVTQVLLVGPRASQLYPDLNGLVRVRSKILRQEDEATCPGVVAVNPDQATQGKWTVVIADASERNLAGSLQVPEGGLFIV